jgi:hypothetical protein
MMVLALPVVLWSQVTTSRTSGEPGPMRIRVESLDSTRSAVVRVQTRGARVRVTSGQVSISGDTVRVSTPATLELESQPGQLALTSEAGPNLQIDIAPTSGARVPRLVGTAGTITVTRAERGGQVRLWTDRLWVREP